MAFGVTPEGFKAKKFDDIIAELSVSLKNDLGIDIDSSPDSVAKALTNIYTLALAEEWALPQALQSMFDIDKAEGKHLDDLVSYLNLVRLEATQSFGNVYINTDQPVLSVPTPSSFKDILDRTYTNAAAIVVDNNSWVDISLNIDNTTVVNDVLTVTINGITSSITVTTTLAAAVTDLVNNITFLTLSNGVTAVDKTVGTIYSILVTNNSDLIKSDITTTANITVNNKTGFGNIDLDTFGELNVPPNTVTGQPPVSGIVSVNNRYIFVNGRNRETDLELRTRHKLSTARGGSATVEAIRADLLSLSGVVTAVVTENTSIQPTSIGEPPKSFSCVVKGGSDIDIANTIWNSKGAGIETFGKSIILATDKLGNSQPIKFSRPTPIYIHVHINYSLYDEQASLFPLDGDTQIKTTIESYGNGLSIGEDVIPQRLASQIFQGINGLSIVEVTIGATSNSTAPTPPLTNNILSIDNISESVFNITRITTTKV